MKIPVWAYRIKGQRVEGLKVQKIPGLYGDCKKLFRGGPPGGKHPNNFRVRTWRFVQVYLLPFQKSIPFRYSPWAIEQASCAIVDWNNQRPEWRFFWFFFMRLIATGFVMCEFQFVILLSCLALLAHHLVNGFYQTTAKRKSSFQGCGFCRNKKKKVWKNFMQTIHTIHIWHTSTENVHGTQQKQVGIFGGIGIRSDFLE